MNFHQIRNSFLPALLLSAFLVAVAGCSSNEPEVLEYSADDVKSMDEAMGIGADGEALDNPGFDKKI